ncbi:spore germination protein [Paenibacillus sp. ACRRX]|uniref:spore germination protein n=1 Tax=unclassified Paenibacillus TaxID=185978 RepID=UPI001EF710AF|nr:MULTISPECIES: spore germination protein [unclassified Paenibacillus]MCG7406889.1 spore germination protein [Paenibacillus sp. ACRRX]MDK8179822.1 spore germination protein [Paenibacillus sp. UMB4589-SE434]
MFDPTAMDAIHLEHHLMHTFKHTEDLTIQTLQGQQCKIYVAYFDTLADKKKLHRYVFEALMPVVAGQQDIAITSTLHFKIMQESEDLQDLLLTGSCLIQIEGERQIYAVDVSIEPPRSVEEPENEKVIQGSHEGFVEELRRNVYLIRKTLKTKDLVVKYMKIGDSVQSELCLIYMPDRAELQVIGEIEQRILTAKTNGLRSAGDLEQLIEDSTMSPFPQMLNTERVDRVIALLKQGKVILFVEGSPTCLVAPVNFNDFMRASDDYNSRWMTSIFISGLRWLSILVAIFLPAFYIAVVAFHFEVLPDELVMPIKTSINEIPFPPLIEAFIMELTIELIREAGLRLPARIGATVSIVGGLVIGDAIVKAGFISTTMIIVVAITAIAAFCIPTHEMSETVRLLRFPFMLLAACLGFVGMSFGIILILGHLCQLESFGSPYFVLFTLEELKKQVRVFLFGRSNPSTRQTRLQRIQQQINTKGWNFLVRKKR